MTLASVALVLGLSLGQHAPAADPHAAPADAHGAPAAAHGEAAAHGGGHRRRSPRP